MIRNRTNHTPCFKSETGNSDQQFPFPERAWNSRLDKPTSVIICPSLDVLLAPTQSSALRDICLTLLNLFIIRVVSLFITISVISWVDINISGITSLCFMYIWLTNVFKVLIAFPVMTSVLCDRQIDEYFVFFRQIVIMVTVKAMFDATVLTTFWCISQYYW